MFTTTEQVKQFTGKDVSEEILWQAQTMIEIFTGRTEAQIDDAGDELILARATSFQAAYIMDNPEIAFAQSAIKSISTGGEYSVTMDTAMYSPFMAPWAVLACRSLTWVRTRSVSTGPIFSVSKSQQQTWVTD